MLYALLGWKLFLFAFSPKMNLSLGAQSLLLSSRPSGASVESLRGPPGPSTQQKLDFKLTVPWSEWVAVKITAQLFKPSGIASGLLATSPVHELLRGPLWIWGALIYNVWGLPCFSGFHLSIQRQQTHVSQAHVEYSLRQTTFLAIRHTLTDLKW